MSEAAKQSPESIFQSVIRVAQICAYRFSPSRDELIAVSEGRGKFYAIGEEIVYRPHTLKP